MKRFTKIATLVTTLALGASTSGCYMRGGGGVLAAMAGTAIVTAAIVSAERPPPPRVVYVPAPRPGYIWQPGYWTRIHHHWAWVEGTWIEVSPGYAWVPTHWERAPDGRWQLIRGYWACAGETPCS